MEKLKLYNLKFVVMAVLLSLIICFNNISIANEEVLENTIENVVTNDMNFNKDKKENMTTATPKITVKIGETESSYDDLKSAVAAASKTEQTLITLNDNVEISAEIKTIAGNNIVIDGQSTYVISRGTLTNGTKYAKTLFNVVKDSKLELKNLTIDNGNNYSFDKAGYDAAVELGEKESNVFRYITSETNGVSVTDWVVKVAGEVNAINSTFKNLYSEASVGTFSGSAGSKINLESVIITHMASKAGGIAIYTTGANAFASVNGNTKIHDIFTAGNGGILKIYSGAKLEMNNGEISDVSAINCNGVVSMSYGAGSTFTLNNGVLKNNSGVPGTSNGRNGMIYIHSGSKFIMNGGTIEDNRGQSCGGIDAPGHATSSLELNAGTIKNNINNGNQISRSDVSIIADYDVVIGEGMYIEGYIHVAGDVTNNGTVKGWIVTDLTTNTNDVAYKGTGTVDGDVIVYHNEGVEPKVENAENILGDPVWCGPTETLAAVIFVNGQVNEKGRWYELHDVEKDKVLNIDDPKKKGHSTSDYYADENLENVMDQIITDKTIVYTEFVPNKYKTTWEVDGKKVEVDVVYGEEIKALEEPKKEGYTFIGWERIY